MLLNAHSGKKLKDDHTLFDYNFHKKWPSVDLELKKVIQIFVQMQTYKTMVLEVLPSDTIEVVKMEIEEEQEEEKTPVGQQRLIFAGQHLKNSWTLSDYNIQGECTLTLLIRRENEMQIFVHSFRGKIFALEVKPPDTITEVKAKILEKEEIPVKDQRLMFGGKKLEDTMTLADYKVKEEFRHEMQIHIKPAEDKIICLGVETSYTVYDVKTKIQETKGIPVEKQKLYFKSVLLEDDSKSLLDYNVQNEHIIDIQDC